MLLLALRLLLDARLASALLGGDWLVAIQERECPSGWCSVHRRDAWMERTLGEGMGTRGAHGHVAAFALPAWAHPWPWVLDVPLVSAAVSVRRAASPACSRVLGCRQWRGRG